MGFGKRTSAVYRWERECVDPHDRSRVDVTAARGIVAYVWSTYGLSTPPKVEVKRGTWLDGSRSLIRMPERCRTVDVLHELAHTMDMSAEYQLGIRDDRTREEYDEDAHGPNWLGLYVNLLDKFMPQPEYRKLYLMGELAKRRLDFSFAPKLRCL